MNDKKILVIAATSLVIGMIVGDCMAAKRISNRFEQKKALIANGLKSAVRNALENDMTEEEFIGELHREMEFINIIS